MAEKFRFYKIGEANAEIEKLDAENKKLSARVAELDAAVSGNDSEIAEQLKTRDASIKTLTDELAALKVEKEKVEKQFADSKLLQADFDVKVEKAASAKALQISASQGVTVPLAAKPGDPAAAKKSDISELKGAAKVQASIRAELEASGNLKK